MKVIHLISGGDTGGAKTHVHSLLKGLSDHIQADMICFTDGPFVQEARELGIHVEVMGGRNPLSAVKPLQKKILEGKDGRRLRRIVSNARKEIIQLLGQNVFLDLRIKVLKNWQSDPKSLGRLGF